MGVLLILIIATNIHVVSYIQGKNNLTFNFVLKTLGI